MLIVIELFVKDQSELDSRELVAPSFCGLAAALWLLVLQTRTESCHQSVLEKSVEHAFWGNVCPVRARHATFLLTIPTSAPDLPSHGEAPQVDHSRLHTFPTKHAA